MGTTLGDAVRGPSRSGEAAAILAALADLGPEHIAVLEVLETRRDGEVWNLDVLREELPVSRDLVDLCLSSLETAGLAGRESMFFGGSPSYGITQLGVTVLHVLRTLDAPALDGHGTVHSP